MSDAYDPTGKRALFEAPVAAAHDRITVGAVHEGRAALFSTPPRRAGTVVIECSGCKARSRESIAELGLRLITGSMWNPFRSRSHWLRCPSCEQRQWCRIGWTE